MMELWILLALGVAVAAIAAWNRLGRGRKSKGQDEDEERKIYPLW